MRLAASLNMITHQDREITDSMVRMKRYGFVCQDFDACTYCGDRAIPGTTALTSDTWLRWIDEIGECMSRENIQLTQCHGPMYNYFETDEITSIHHESTNRVLQACRRLGIPRVVLHPVVPPGKQSLQDIDACRKANVVFLSGVAETAAKQDITLCLENMYTGRNQNGSIFWRYCSNPTELIDLVDSIKMENVQVCMDIGHAHLMGETLSHSMYQYGQRLQALHIHDNDGCSDQHLIPYLGTIDWQDVLTGLRSAGYIGDFTMEIPNVSIRMPKALRETGIRAAYSVGRYLLSNMQNSNATKGMNL